MIDSQLMIDPQLLSRREREVLALITEGKSNRDIAQSLQIAENTVEQHLKNIFRKLNVKNRTQAGNKYRLLS